MNYGDLLTFVAPETLLALAAFAVLGIDLTNLRASPARDRLRFAARLAVLGCAASALAMFLTPASTPPGYLDGMLALTPLTRVVKLVILVLSACTALISVETDFTDHAGEYFALLLLATTGMMFLVTTENLLLIFVSLELLSLSLYIMTAFNKRNVASAEAALKYFLIGGMSAAFLLFGLSLVYGVSGEINLRAVATALGGKPLDPLLVTALVMILVGFGFKVAAVPFHLWAPDVYQGAPTPSAALIASGSKVASFFVLARMLMAGFDGVGGSGAWRNYATGWIPMLALLAALSMLLGNLAAIVQKSVRRLLAYSAIAHAGYMLVGLLANDRHGLAALIYYASTYAFTTVGAFGVVALVEAQGGREDLAAFAGLRQRAPWASLCLLVFMLSLAGIPPLAGFFGKFYLFSAALLGTKSLGLLWLVIVALSLSAVSLYYYLQVLKQAFAAAPAEGARPIESAFSTRVVLCLLALAVVALGCAPNWFLRTLADVQL